MRRILISAAVSLVAISSLTLPGCVDAGTGTSTATLGETLTQLAGSDATASDIEATPDGVAGETFELGAPGGGRGIGGRGIGGRGFGPGTPPELTDEQIATLESIRARVESGEITHEQAREEVRALLGDDIPMGGPRPFLENLTEEQRAALDSIRERVESGEITHEQAHEEVRALLGDDFPMGGPPPFLENLTDEQRAALDSIRERVESGEITREQAREEVRALLGDDFPLRREAWAGFTAASAAEAVSAWAVGRS